MGGGVSEWEEEEVEEAAAAGPPRDGGGRRAHCECLPHSATPCPLPPPGAPLPRRGSFSGAGAPRDGRSRSRRCPGGAGGMLFPASFPSAAHALVAGVYCSRYLSPAALVPLSPCRRLPWAEPAGPVLAGSAAGSCCSLFQL